MPEVLDRPQHVMIGGQEYMLLRGDIGQIEAFQRRTGAKRWKITSQPVATTIIPRPDVRPGEYPGEYVWTIKDWSRGVSKEDSKAGGTLAFCRGVNGLTGALTPNAASAAGLAINGEANLTKPIEFNNEIFVAQGRYIYRFDGNGVSQQDKDFGTGVLVTDLIVHNNELVVGFGGSTNKIQTRNTSGTWTAATDAVYIACFGAVEARLWVNQSNLTGGNQVSNIGPTDNPRTLANYSAGITVGLSGIGISALAGLGPRLLVAKPDGLFPGDAAAKFENKLPQMAFALAATNGLVLTVRGDQVYYGHSRGLIQWSPRGITEIGLHDAVLGNVRDGTFSVPGYQFTALCIDGHYLWGACEPSGYPRVDVGGFQKTTDNGVGYTDYTANVTDNDTVTIANLNALDTVANGDWIVVSTEAAGAGAAYQGVYLEITRPNTVASVLTAEYWNGSAWVALTGVIDGTAAPPISSPRSQPTITLAKSGLIRWETQSGWTASTINGINRLWARLSFSVALAAVVSVGEARALRAGAGTTPASDGWLYRGRNARPGDVGTSPIVWEPFDAITSNSLPTGISAFGSKLYPFKPGGSIVVTGRTWTRTFFPPFAAQEQGLVEETTNLVAQMGFDDLGMPGVLKRFLSFRSAGRNLSVSNVSGVLYTNGFGAGTSSSFTINANNDSAALTAIEGYNVAPSLTFAAFAADNWPILQELEFVFRLLHTYKEEYEMVLLVADRQPSSGRGQLPSAITQITNLEALRSTGGVAFKDPLRQAKTVTVFEVNEIEAYSFGRGMPASAVQIRLVEE